MKKEGGRREGESGQGVVAGAIALFAALSILVPMIVYFVQNESKETEKERKMTAAFQLAEAATERGYWEISQLSSPTASIPLAGYNFDQEYSDLANGTYAISIGSDAAEDIVITGVGRDALKKELREVQVVYALPAASNSSMFSAGANAISGNESVEWGPIYSQTSISTGRTYPRLYSNGTIAGYGPSSCSNAPPCTDDVHYWSCSCAPYVPMPSVDFNYYKTLAQAEGNTAPSGCGCSAATCPHYVNTSGTVNFNGCQDASGVSGGNPTVYYIDGNATVSFSASNPKNFIVGSVIVTGGGSWQLSGQDGSGSYAASVPPYSWREYCLNGTTWSHYQSIGGGAASWNSSCGSSSGINATYELTGATYGLNDVLVHGFVYVGSGGIALTGSGGTVVHGALYTSGAITGNAHITVYFDSQATQNIHTSASQLYTRQSWKEVAALWPTALP